MAELESRHVAAAQRCQWTAANLAGSAWPEGAVSAGLGRAQGRAEVHESVVAELARLRRLAGLGEGPSA